MNFEIKFVFNTTFLILYPVMFSIELHYSLYINVGDFCVQSYEAVLNECAYLYCPVDFKVISFKPIYIEYFEKLLKV